MTYVAPFLNSNILKLYYLKWQLNNGDFNVSSV
jgi:hypothetical protein